MSLAWRKLLVLSLCVSSMACRMEPPATVVPQPCTEHCVGSSPLSAITRDEYRFSVSDVLGVSDARITALPVDGSFDQFAGNATTPRGPDAATAYEIAANEVATAAAASLSTTCTDAACVAPLVRESGARLFRRRLTDAEVSDYQSLYELVLPDVGHVAALAAVLSGLLQSPSFLYRVELGEPTSGGAVRALSGFEMASRLAGFLWRSVPDAALLDAAERGALTTDEGISIEVARMMADPRFDRALASFHDGWLGTGDVATSDGLPADLLDDMHEELTRYVASILRSDRATLARLLSEPSAPISTPLAENYGVAAPAHEWDQAMVPDHPGLLGRALPILANTGSTQMRSIHRGAFIHRRMLCRAIGAPPPEAAARTSAFVRDPAWSDREYVTRLTLDDAACAGCHTQFGRIGFGLDGYDRLARFVPGQDDSGELDGMGFEGASGLEALLASPEVEDCVAHRWLSFALGRNAVSTETQLVDRVAHDQRADADTFDLAEYIALVPHTAVFRTLPSH